MVVIVGHFFLKSFNYLTLQVNKTVFISQLKGME